MGSALPTPDPDDERSHRQEADCCTVDEQCDAQASSAQRRDWRRARARANQQGDVCEQGERQQLRWPGPGEKLPTVGVDEKDFFWDIRFLIIYYCQGYHKSIPLQTNISCSFIRTKHGVF